MVSGDLGRRLGVAVLGIPAGIGIAYLGVWAVAAAVSVLAAVGVAEVYRFAEARGVRPFPWVGIPAGAVLVLAAAWAGGVQAWGVWCWVIVLGVALGGLAGSLFVRGPEGGPLAAVATTLFGVVYVGATLSFAVHLRAFPGISDGGMGWAGALIVMFPLTATWCGDSGAYFAGRRLGRRKLMPSVSPAKTVEGALGGLAGAMVGAALFSALFLPPGGGTGLAPLPGALLGILIGAVAQVGDLTESLLKREAGVKDSGTILPGHGGVLDRFDAVLFTLPITYALLPFFLR